MKRRQLILIALAAIAFISLIVWMLPPTRLPGDTKASAAGRARAPTLRPPLPAEIAAASAPDPDPAVSGPPTAATQQQYGGYAEMPAEHSQYADDPPPRPPRPPRAPAPDAADPADGDVAYTDDRPDPDFEAGYLWAERNQITSRRECRIWSGSGREDGCRAFVREASEDREPPDGL